MLYHNVTFTVAPSAYEQLLQDLMTKGMIPHIISDNLQEYVSTTTTWGRVQGCVTMTTRGRVRGLVR